MIQDHWPSYQVRCSLVVDIFFARCVLGYLKGVATFSSIVSLISQIVRFVSNNHLGPSFAREIVEGVATAVVIASEDLDLAHDLAVLFSDKNCKCYTSQDVVGVEIGGAVKNVVALGAGMCEGLGLGTNAMSGLVTRGCNEMRRLGLTFGARPSTIAGLSGMYHYSQCAVICLFVLLS